MPFGNDTGNKVAEGTGFEPAIGFDPYNGLANRRLQPLGHPSTDEWNITAYAGTLLLAGVSSVNARLFAAIDIRKASFFTSF